MRNELIVVTGASSGIGAETAKQLNAAGYFLLLLARRLEELEALNLSRTMCRKVDVRNRDEFRAAINDAEAAYGPVHGIVNNAGVMLLGDMDKQDPVEWDEMIDVNIKGVLNGIHMVLSSMLDRHTGTIINISSVAGRKTFPQHTVYCATKFAVRGLSEGLREEASQAGVRVLTIEPGATETELLSHTNNGDIKEKYEVWKKSIGGALTSQSVAKCVLFALAQPQDVSIRRIELAPTKQQP